MPRVSILMPVYNAERFLRESIDSLLSQTYRDFELLILNDGSTDGSRTIVKSYADPRIRLVDNERNRGLTATLNRGLAEATAELVARQDADDLSSRDRIAKQVEFLTRHPDVALVGTQAKFINERGFSSGAILPRALCHDSIKWDLLFDNSFTHSSVMFRKEAVFGELGGYDETFSYCQDYALWSRVAQAHRVANLPENLVGYRVHPYARMSDRMQHAIVAENYRVVRSNMQAAFGSESIPEEDVEAVVGVRLMCRPSFVEKTLDVVKKAIDHQQRHAPESWQNDKDFRDTVARRYVRIANKALRVNAGLAWHVLAHAWQRYPVVRVSASWILDALSTMLRESPQYLWHRLAESAPAALSTR